MILEDFCSLKIANSSVICSLRVAISSSWRWVIRIIVERYRAIVDTNADSSGNGNGSSAARPNSGKPRLSITQLAIATVVKINVTGCAMLLVALATAFCSARASL